MVKVKALKWPEDCPRGSRVYSSGGIVSYTISCTGIYRWARRDGPWSLECGTFDNAKMAVQENYREMILSALEEE